MLTDSSIHLFSQKCLLKASSVRHCARLSCATCHSASRVVMMGISIFSLPPSFAITESKQQALLFAAGMVLDKEPSWVNGEWHSASKEWDLQFRLLLDGWGVRALRRLENAPSLSLLAQRSSHLVPYFCVVVLLGRHFLRTGNTYIFWQYIPTA